MNDVTRQVVVLPVPKGAEFRQETGFKFGSQGRTMDLCYPGRDTDEGWPVTVLVGGYPDSGFERGMGCKFKEMASLRSWSQLIASTGIVAVTYECEEPVTDLFDVISNLKESADEIGVDQNRIALWSCSGNAPTALGAIAELSTDLRCAVLCYGTY